MARKLQVYHLSPIDFWTGWLTREQYLENVELEEFGESRKAAEQRLDDLVARAEAKAKHIGWEGDYRQGPFFVALPTNGEESETIVAWKQDNNGITFVASPFPLPWLD